MKFRITQKEAREYLQLYRVNHDLSYIIRQFTDITTAYHAGVYGWNADIFIKGRIGLEQGYRHIAKEAVPEKLQKRVYKKCLHIMHTEPNNSKADIKIKKVIDKLYNELENSL